MTPDQQYCIDGLAQVFGGHHHLTGVKEFGDGVCISHYGDLSTYDFNHLTQLVLMAHARFIRVEVMQGGPRSVKIAAWKRQPRQDGDRQHQRHPGIEELIEEAKKWL